MKNFLPGKVPAPAQGFRGWSMTAAGAGLLLVGWVLIFLTVLRVLPASWWLVVTAYPLTLLGLVLGLMSAAEYVAAGRVRREGPFGLEKQDPLG